MEFSYTENDVLKFAILDNENIGILKIAKPHHEFCLTATLEKPLLIRDGIGSILGNDTSGIKTVTMQLYGDFEESDMIELFGNIVRVMPMALFPQSFSNNFYLWAILDSREIQFRRRNNYQ